MHSTHQTYILLASEFAIFRNGIKLILEKECEYKIIGEANNKNEIFEILQHTVPNVIILNLNLEADSLNSLCSNIHLKYPKIPILLFLEDSMKNSLAELIVSGVRGVIWKENTDIELIDVIKCIVQGSLYFEDPENCRTNCHLSKKICESESLNELDDLLSEREIEVLEFIAKGMPYKQIANLLNISTRTVESHKNHMLTKLDLNNKYELMRYAISKFNM